MTTDPKTVRIHPVSAAGAESGEGEGARAAGESALPGAPLRDAQWYHRPGTLHLGAPPPLERTRATSGGRGPGKFRADNCAPSSTSETRSASKASTTFWMCDTARRMRPVVSQRPSSSRTQ